MLENGKEMSIEGEVLVSMPVPKKFNANSCKVYWIKEDGSMEDMKAVLNNGRLEFTTTHFSIYAIIGDFILADYDIYFSFDNSIDNAKAITKGIYANIGTYVQKDFQYAEGKNNQAIIINDNNDNVGLDTNVIINSMDSFTISFWMKAYNVLFAAPVIWIGDKNQSVESWLGFWAGFNTGNWSMAGIGSNDAYNTYAKISVPISDTDQFDFKYITFSYNAQEQTAILYYDGKQVGSVNGLPILRDNSHIYLGANAWDAPSHMEIDDLVIYRRILSNEEVEELYKENGVPCEQQCIIFGDANGDGEVDSKDAVLIKKYLAGYTGLNIDKNAANVNGDGEVDSKDAVRILRYLAGYDVTLGEA